MRDLCQSPDAAIAKYGQAAALALFGRIADVRAADTSSDLLDFVASHGDSEMELIVPLGAGVEGRVVFKANHPACPRNASGEVDWTRVTRLQAVRVEVGK